MKRREMAETNEKSNLLDEKTKNVAAKDVEKLDNLPNDTTDMDEQDKKENTRRNRAGGEKRKLYEVMLLEEIPETKRPNEPTHAVLEGELGEWEVDGQSNQNVRNHALIHYIADLANSNNPDDVFDYDFVESLLLNGADINCMDPTRQTIFHEVSRSWNTDVAKFLVDQGANVNHQDMYGRSPLHVAAAVDYASMVEFILQHGGDVNIKTKGEEQTAIYYAAKNDAIKSLQMLLGYGGNIDARDYRNRTPLQVAAEMNRFKAAKLLVSEGAPAGVYDHMGNSALSLLIEKIPEVALIALDQFHTVDYINRREFYFLNYLEGAKLQDGLQETPARSPLEIAVQNERFDVIMHPVMRRLIAVKWKIYGKTGAFLDLGLNLIYTILWTVEGVTMPRNGHELYLPVRKNAWRYAVDSLILLFTLMEIKRQIKRTINARRELVKWREWRAEQLQKDKQFCHPRWPQESKHLDSEIAAVKGLSLVSSSDKWVYFDWICLFLILATITTNILFFEEDSQIWKNINNHTTVAMLLILWLRMFKYARPFENAGPFVVIFSNVVGDILKWAVLNMIIIIPFACAFWIEFGFNSSNPAEGYTDVSSLLYNIFQMMIIGDYGWEKLKAANQGMARILCMCFILVAGIITLNLLIALVSNTFERHYENAVANAVMQRASTILLLQSRMGYKKRKQYYEFIKANASPQIIQQKFGRLMASNPEDRANIERVYDDVRQIKSVLDERFGRRYGKGNKSDLEIVREDLGKIKKSGKELTRAIKNIKLILYGIGGQPVSPGLPGDRKDLCRMSSAETCRIRRDDNDSDEGTLRKMKKNIGGNNTNNNNYNNRNNTNKNNDSYNNNDNNNNTYNPNKKSQQYPSESNVENMSHPRKKRSRNRSRRSKMPEPTSSADSDDDSISCQPGTPFPFTSRDFKEDAHRRRMEKSQFKGNSRLKRIGEENWNRGDYNQWLPYDHFGEQDIQHFSPRSERRYVDPHYGGHESPIPMHPSINVVYPRHRRESSIPYYPEVSSQTRSLPPTFSPQHGRSLVSLHQRRLGAQMGPYPQEYLMQSDDFGSSSVYRRPSRDVLIRSATQRNDPGSQYSDSDYKSTEQRQRGGITKSEVPRQAGAGGQVSKNQGEEEILQKRQRENSVSNVKKYSEEEVKSEESVKGTKNESNC
ncbi:uncharacterized protein LOC114521948 [Dendronephthya gigantea]|uniref:uncharacterized protein LOC114521948 n=1 Tax=Dendronephthya gigantea TaxID=151771 RepID=UPI00106AFABF|nr:uncharacterized protein LOC114521948 [Dendronephthya gigantea]